MAILFIFVKEPKRRECATKVTLKGAKRIMDRAFSMYIGSAALYAVAAISYSFILLKGIEMGLPAEYTALIYAGIQACHVASGYPAGVISDRVGRIRAVQIGYALLFASFLTMAVAPSVQNSYWAPCSSGCVVETYRGRFPHLVPRLKAAAASTTPQSASNAADEPLRASSSARWGARLPSAMARHSRLRRRLRWW